MKTRTRPTRVQYQSLWCLLTRQRERELIELRRYVSALRAAAAIFFFVVSVGCAPSPLKGGRASIGPAGTIAPIEAVSATMIEQSANPASASKQTEETETRDVLTLPAGTVVKQSVGTGSNAAVLSATLPALSTWEKTTRRKVGQEIGAAQKDTGREIAAKLASLRWMQWVGVVLIVGAAAMFHPVVFAFIGSRTTQGMIALAGFALVFLPVVIVGHEMLIFFGAVAVLAAWWLAHHHGQLRGTVKTLLAK